eukprot:7861011-Pyramimonas_sp.AAC.1
MRHAIRHARMRACGAKGAVRVLVAAGGAVRVVGLGRGARGGPWAPVQRAKCSHPRGDRNPCGIRAAGGAGIP